MKWTFQQKSSDNVEEDPDCTKLHASLNDLPKDVKMAVP